MDKRRKPLTPHEQLKRRLILCADIAAHPEWDFVRVLKHIRATLHLTLSDMAKVGRVSVAALKKIEAGLSQPTLKTVDALLKPFGLRVSIIPRESTPMGAFEQGGPTN